MRRVVLSLATALIVAGAVSFSVVPNTATRAAKGEQSVFLLPPTDGYGIAECLTGDRECGKIVANAWCEAKGFARAASYGAASPTEITGSVAGRASDASKEPPLVITCAE